jgi:hypothetical protein
MAEKTERNEDLQRVRDLATAALVDTLYRDLFLERAVNKLRGVFPESAYRDAGGIESRIAMLLAESRRAVDRQDWAKVKATSAQVTQLRAELQQATANLEIAKQVYEAPPVAVDPLCVELQPLLKDQMTVNAARNAALEAFEHLITSDPEWADFHRRRQAYFNSLQTARTDTKTPAAKKGSSVAQLRQEAQHAAAAGDVARLESLAEEILAAGAESREAEGGASTSAAAASVVVPQEVQKPFEKTAVDKARSLGLAHLETKPEADGTARKIADFVQQYQWQATSSAAETATEGSIRLNELLREIKVPAELAQPASTVILMFALNPFVNSAGVRYVVHFSPEYVLVEDFPETTDPPASELLGALKLPQRRSLARLQIESALREHGASILEERLGLDPKEYRLVCVPYDIYLRAGRELGWGQQQWWTHVDGYQLGRGTRLRALVAGDVRHGGLFDLCAIGADDAREAVMARFAVVRRARMAIGRA